MVYQHSESYVRGRRTMRVDTNLTFMARQAKENRQAEKEKDGRAAGKNGSQTVFIGSLQGDYSLQGRIQQKRERAQKRAMKIVNEAWNGDREIEDQIGGLKKRINEIRGEWKAASDEVHRIRGEMEELREAYGVEADSREEKDLELLKRAQAQGRPNVAELSGEEREQVEALKENGLTEYQSRVLELNKSLLGYQAEVGRGKGEIVEANEKIRRIREERRKIHPILDAREQAEEILDAAEEEITGMVADDAKEHLDEEKEKREEQAEEIREEKEKQEEIEEKREEKQEERDETLEELMGDLPMDKMMDMDQTLSEVKRQIQNVLNEMTLVTEDIKGSQVDASV